MFKKYNIIKQSILKYIFEHNNIINRMVLNIAVRIKYRGYYKSLSKIGNPSCKKFESYDKINKILIVRLDAIGDFVWTSALIRELRRNLPTKKIDMIVRPQIKSLVEYCPYINNVYVFDCKLGVNNLPDDIVEMNRVKNFSQEIIMPNNYDVVILPREMFYGEIGYEFAIANASKITTIIGRGYATNPIERICSARVKKYFSVWSELSVCKHEVVQMLDMLKCTGLHIYDDSMEIWRNHVWDSNLNTLVEKNDNIINIAVGLRGSSANRDWSIEKYNKVFNTLFAKYGCNVKFIILGGKDICDAGKILERNSNCINLVGQTDIKDVIDVINNCDMYFGVDTGLMHIAAALGKPVVELSVHIKNGNIMQNGSQELMGPWKVPSIILEPQNGLDNCCDWCRKDYPHCINTITTDDVIVALEKMITMLMTKKKKRL